MLSTELLRVMPDIVCPSDFRLGLAYSFEFAAKTLFGSVTTKIIPAVKITGATHDISSPVNVLSSHGAFALNPDPCTSSSSNMMPSMEVIDPISTSPVLSGEPDCFHDELEFDKFLLDAADWL